MYSLPVFHRSEALQQSEARSVSAGLQMQTQCQAWQEAVVPAKEVRDVRRRVLYKITEMGRQRVQGVCRVSLERTWIAASSGVAHAIQIASSSPECLSNRCLICAIASRS